MDWRFSSAEGKAAMTCNLAVAITKAAITDARLRALLDLHSDQVQRLLVQLLRKQYSELSVQGSSEDSRVIEVGPMMVRVIGGSLTVDGPRTRERLVKEVTDKATAMLTLIADQLFTYDVRRVLQESASVTGIATSDVENQGKIQRATVIAFTMNDLKARVFVLPGGRIQMFIDSGSFAQAKAATGQVLATLQAQGVEVQMIGEVESHRTGGDHVHVQQQRGIQQYDHS